MESASRSHGAGGSLRSLRHRSQEVWARHVHRFGQSCDAHSLRPKPRQPTCFASSGKSVTERQVYLDTSVVLPLYREEVLTPQAEALHPGVAPAFAVEQ